MSTTRVKKSSLPGAKLESGVHMVDIDQLKLTELLGQMKAEQSVLRGLAGGVAAGAIAAVVWALLTRITGYEMGWIAVGVGFFVGVAVRTLGRGVDLRFNVLGALLALLAVAGGKVLAMCMFVAQVRGLSGFEIFSQLPCSSMVTLLRDDFQLIDGLFYGLAIWAGWEYATRQMSQEELASVLHPMR